MAADPTAPAVQFGWTYTQELYRTGLERGQRHYTPLLRSVERYFAIDTRYVRRKLRLLLAPSPRVAREGGGARTFAGDDDEAPTHPQLPRDDVDASDLYIGCTAALAFVVLCGAARDGRSPVDRIGAAFSSLVVWSVLEVLVLQCVGMVVLALPATMTVLETAALVLYKLVAVDAALLVTLAMSPLELGGVAVCAAAYAAAAAGVFAYRLLHQHYAKGRYAHAGTATAAVAVAEGLMAAWYTLRRP